MNATAEERTDVDELLDELHQRVAVLEEIDESKAQNFHERHRDWITQINKLIPLLTPSSDTKSVKTMKKNAVALSAALTRYPNQLNQATAPGGTFVNSIPWALLVVDHYEAAAESANTAEQRILEVIKEQKATAAKAVAATAAASKTLGELRDEEKAGFKTLRTSLAQQQSDELDELKKAVDGANKHFFDERTADTEKQIAELSALKQEAQEELDEISRLVDEAREQMTAFGDTALSGGYDAAATQAHKDGTEMRDKAKFAGYVAVGLAFVALAGTFILKLLDKDVPFFGFGLPTLTVVAATGAVAAYLGKEASRDLDDAMRLRRIVLELRNLGPFTATLEKSDQQKIRNDLISKYFSGGESEVPVPNAPLTPGQRATKKAIDTAKTPNKKSKVIDLTEPANANGAETST